MKKIFLITTILSLTVSFGHVFAYNDIDIANAQFLASQKLIVNQSNISKFRLDDTITRSEVAKIGLTLKGIVIPTNYICKNYFSDVTKNDWVCAAVELAADYGLVTKANVKFRPSDKITRAEALAIIVTSGAIVYPKSVHTSRDDYKNLPQWTIDLLEWTSGKWITNLSWYWFDNTSGFGSTTAIRNEVFQFALGVYTYNYLPKTVFTHKNSSTVLSVKLSCANSEDDLAPGTFPCSSSEYVEKNILYQSFIKQIENREFEKAAITGHTLWWYFFGFWDALNKTIYRVEGDTLFALWLSPQSWWSPYIVTYTLTGKKIVRQIFETNLQDYKNWDSTIKKQFGLQVDQDIYSLIWTNGQIRDDVMKFAEQYWIDLFMNSKIEVPTKN